MNQVTQISALMPVLPEIVIACGAMLLLMVGVGISQTERSARLVNSFCIAVLALTAFIIATQSPGRVMLFGGSFVVDDYARFLKLLAITGSAGALILCDRGTLDGLAYWPEAEESFWAELGSSRSAELARYAAVIHLRTPPAERGYNHQNPLRTDLFFPPRAERPQLDLF